MISAVVTENSQETCSIYYPLTSPLLNTRRMRTDLQTSDNVFLRSRSGSPNLPSKNSHTTTKQSDNNNKRTIGNTAIR